MENNEKIEDAPENTPKSFLGKLFSFKRWILSFLCGFGFAILCFLGLNAAMEQVSSSEYCGTVCHEMDSVYRGWKQSVHGTNESGLRAECIDCHLAPREEYFTHVATKAYLGAKDLYKHYFDEYNREEVRQKVIDNFTNDICLRCHVDLLAKPRDSIVGDIHKEILSTPEDPDSRCIACHESTGHHSE